MIFDLFSYLHSFFVEALEGEVGLFIIIFTLFRSRSQTINFFIQTFDLAPQ